jgi:hypothetical protein
VWNIFPVVLMIGHSVGGLQLYFETECVWPAVTKTLAYSLDFVIFWIHPIFTLEVQSLRSEAAKTPLRKEKYIRFPPFFRLEAHFFGFSLSFSLASFHGNDSHRTDDDGNAFTYQALSFTH